MLQLISTAVLLSALTAISCYFDLKHGTIPNRVTLSFFLAGLTLNSLVGGLGGLGMSLAGSAIGISLLLIPFFLHMVGGGDVKLLGAAGALVGYKLIWWGFLIGAVLGGVLGLLKIVRGEDKKKPKHLFQLSPLLAASFAKINTRNRVKNRERDSGPSSHGIPYAFPLSLGIDLCFFVFMFARMT